MNEITVYNEKQRGEKRTPARKSAPQSFRDPERDRRERVFTANRKARLNEVRERELMYG